MTFAGAIKELGLKHPMTERLVTPRELIDILKEDVVYCIARPGSWEGSNMLAVLQCHGFFMDK